MIDEEEDNLQQTETKFYFIFIKNSLFEFRTNLKLLFMEYDERLLLDKNPGDYAIIY